MATGDVDKVVAAARSLDIAPRGDRWCDLSLCVIDAVFSIGARYGSTWRAARRYATRASLDPATAPAPAVAAGTISRDEQSLDAFLADVGGLPDEELASALGNRQRTSSRGGILKAVAVRQYAEVLVDREVRVLGDVASLLADHDRSKRVEADLAEVRGHGSGVRVSYLWMLAGDDHHVKADRMVMRWLGQSVGRTVRGDKAEQLLRDAAFSLGVTPWELDHAIWRRQSGRQSPATGQAPACARIS